MTATSRSRRYDPTDGKDSEDVPDRHAAMVGAASGLRPTRNARIRFENSLFTLGTICLPLGVVVIIVGWYGVSHTGYVFQQNSYLISGGILGLGLIFIGGFLYFAYWMTRQIRAIETGNQQTTRALSRVEAQLRALSTAVVTAAASSGPALVATERGTLLHRPECKVVSTKAHLRQIAPGTPGFRGCQVCFPFDEAER
jgi:hypothetical protein